LTLEFRRNVFFIYKEILHNIVKHARATSVAICAREDGGRFALEVRDDGCGIANGDQRGQGRGNMERRAREIGGEIQIESAPAGGTLIRLKAPYRTSWFSTYDK
jgi:two-component system nitrate/nitrite sensor histidine kinase NarX